MNESSLIASKPVSSRSTVGVLCLFLFVFCALGPARAAEDPMADQYYRGNALYNRKLHALAIEEFKLFLAKFPDHAKAEHARLGMALSYYAMQKFAEAEPLLKALIAKDQAGDKEQLALLQGQCLLHLDKPADAETVFASVIRSKSKDFVTNATAGVLEAQFRQGKWADCLATADTLLKGETGKLEEAAQKYAAAVTGFEGKVAASEPSAQSALWLGRAYSRQKKYNEAASFCTHF